ncbi:solute carrier family 23 member 3 isoform X2 [Calonectris borealis]|uniref:solute carrier family 23 member 3 isoform X2 n=1 Tax=Calonectris borealis TaxID=1323832 RepID=UPI003F4B5D2A
MNGGHRGAPGARSPVLTFCSPQRMCSWMLSCCLALQHLAVQASLLCIFHLLLLPTLPEEPPHAQATSELLARSLFACGISTVLQTTLGSRLPLVQIPSFEYLVPAMVLSSHLSLGASTDRNGTAVASTCPAPHCAVAGSWTASLREVSGAVLISGLVQLALGMSGMCGWAARHCGPMVLAPSLSIIGLSAYKEAAFFCSTNWGVALLYCSHLLVSALFVPSSAISASPGNRWTWPWHSCPGATAPSMLLGSASLMQVWGGRAGCSHPPSARAPVTRPLSLHCRRVGVATAHPPGAGSGHRHGHRLQHELGGLLRAVWEAAASPPAALPRLQPGTLHGRAGQPPGRAAGHPGGHGCQHRQRLCHRPHAGWLSPLGASKRAGVCGAGHVPEAGRAPHPHPVGSSRGGALRHLRCGRRHGDLLLPVCGHRLGEEHLHRWLCHVHGTAGATVARHSSSSPGHRLGAPGPPLPLPAHGACLLNWFLVIFPGEHGLRNPGGARAALRAGATESWGRRSPALWREG